LFLIIYYEGDFRVDTIESLIEILLLFLLPLASLGSGSEAPAGGAGMVVLVEADEVAVTFNDLF